MDEISSEADLNAKIRKAKRLAVLFFAHWCPFCMRFLPVFRSAVGSSESWEGLLVAIDEDENPLWEKYKIECVPTVLLFVDGKEIRRLSAIPGVGISEKDLKDALQD
ncbi:MAG: thioredoxin family protein [Candidatus Micrarchaeia archaeon]